MERGGEPPAIPSASSRLPPIDCFGRSPADSPMDSQLQQQRSFSYSQSVVDAGYLDPNSALLPRQHGPCPIDPIGKTMNHNRSAEVPSISVESSVCSTPFGPPPSNRRPLPAFPTTSRQDIYEPPQKAFYNGEFSADHFGNHVSQNFQSSQEAACCPLRVEYASDAPWRPPGYHHLPFHYSNPPPVMASVQYYNHPPVFYHQPSSIVVPVEVKGVATKTNTVSSKGTSQKRKNYKDEEHYEDEDEAEVVEKERKGKKARTDEDREKNKIAQQQSRLRKDITKDTLFETIAVANEQNNDSRDALTSKITELIDLVDLNEELKAKLVAFRDIDLMNSFADIGRILSLDDCHWSLDGTPDWNLRLDPKILAGIQTEYGNKKRLVKARKRQQQLEKELQLQIDQFKEKEKEDDLLKMEENILEHINNEAMLLASCRSSEPGPSTAPL